MKFKTEQETFWAGEFGLNYIKRNRSDQIITSKIIMWSKILKSTHSIRSIKEFGCNIGLNLIALNKIKPELELSGIEINTEAAKLASESGIAKIENRTIIDRITDKKVDLTFTCGVLIHINPAHLDAAYENLVNNSHRYILVAEYYNPTPVTVDYRGNKNKLFKRDFAGELIEKHNLKLIDYGFIYHRDNYAPQDDTNWFLLEKQYQQ